MITRLYICSAIDKAAEDIDWCWNILADARANGSGSPISSEVVNFQKKLIAALWKLDDGYREIHAERKRLISQKSKFSSSWFSRRMSKLAEYQQAIRHAISVAKTLGDGFAWIFYHRDRDLIDAHLRSPRQFHLPPNVGRVGERAFVEQFQVIEGKLVIYHGITTFLRMGDVSFYDFSEQRITNIGELKTEHIKDHEYRIHLGFVYGKKFSPVVDIDRHQLKASDSPGMRPEQQIRMNRQLNQILKVVSADHQNRVSRKASQQGLFYFQEFDRLLSDSSTKTLKSQKIGEGLLITALRLPGNGPLSTRLVSSKKFNAGKKLDKITEYAQLLVDPSLADNSLIGGSLGVSERGVPGLMNGTIPIFWWPIKASNLRDLIFSNVVAITLYNPAHFWQSLRTRNFELVIDDKARLLSAKKSLGRKTIEIHNMQYFQTLITRYLMSESDVLAMIDAALQFPTPDDAPMRIEIKPQLRF